MRGRWRRPSLLWLLPACSFVAAACGPEDPFEGALEAVAVSAGFSHSCALLPEGRVACWGKDTWSSLGLPPDTKLVNQQTDRPMMVDESVSSAEQIQCGDQRCCSLAGGELWCWGALGMSRRWSPAEMETGLDIAGPAVGYSPSSCATTSDGEVWCWGRMSPPVEGEESEEPAYPWQDPVRIEGVADALVVGVGAYHACALERSGALKCWGRRLDLDVSTWHHEETVWEPYELGHVDRPSGLTMAWVGGCVWSEDGLGWCFGDNAYGQIGDGTTDYRGRLVMVEGLSDIVQMSTASAGGAAHTCALEGDGRVLCWGSNSAGQLGDGESGSYIAPTPWPVRDLPPARFVAVGNRTSFAILEDGRVAAWGSNGFGALGTGTTSDVPIPVLPVVP